MGNTNSLLSGGRIATWVTFLKCLQRACWYWMGNGDHWDAGTGWGTVTVGMPGGERGSWVLTGKAEKRKRRWVCPLLMKCPHAAFQRWDSLFAASSKVRQDGLERSKGGPHAHGWDHISSGSHTTTSRAKEILLLGQRGVCISKLWTHRGASYTYTCISPPSKLGFSFAFPGSRGRAHSGCIQNVTVLQKQRLANKWGLKFSSWAFRGFYLSLLWPNMLLTGPKSHVIDTAAQLP